MNFSDTMHICWRTAVSGSYTSWERLKYADGNTYTISLVSITATKSACPKLVGFSHDLGTVIESTNDIWFEISNTLDNTTLYTFGNGVKIAHTYTYIEGK